MERGALGVEDPDRDRGEREQGKADRGIHLGAGADHLERGELEVAERVIEEEEREGPAQRRDCGGGEVEHAALQVADDESIFVDLQNCVR